MDLITDNIFEFVKSKSINTNIKIGTDSLFNDEVKEWIYKYAFKNQVDVIINKGKLLLLIKGDIVIKEDSYPRVTELPPFINFLQVDKDFIIMADFTTMRGFPQTIGGDFYIAHNKLTSLNDCPQTVGGDFFIKNNETVFTEEEIRKVCNVKGTIYA